jgi:hypothetical protein
MVKNFSDEMLVAFVDGMLDDASGRAIEQAMRDDPVIAQRVARQRALRSHVSAASSPAPGTRPMAQMSARGGKVIQLALVRASKGKAPAAVAAAASASSVDGAVRWSWPQWGALVTAMITGIVVGWCAVSLLERDTSMIGSDGALRARGQLTDALTGQAASVTGSGVRIGASFMSKQGHYCRSFVLDGVAARTHLAGLACHIGTGWNVVAIIDEPMPMPASLSSPAADGTLMSGIDLPPVIDAAIDQRIAGQVLDAAAEQEALRRGWRR